MDEQPAGTAGDAEHPQPAEPITLASGLVLVPTDEENVYMNPRDGELYTPAGQRLGRMRAVK